MYEREIEFETNLSYIEADKKKKKRKRKTEKHEAVVYEREMD